MLTKKGYCDVNELFAELGKELVGKKINIILPEVAGNLSDQEYICCGTNQRELSLDFTINTKCMETDTTPLVLVRSKDRPRCKESCHYNTKLKDIQLL